MPPEQILQPEHLILTGARSEAFVGSTRLILGRLGYRIFSVRELAEAEEAGGGPGRQIEMLILDEHRLLAADELDPDGLLPIILLTGRAGIRTPDSRIIAAVKKPAGLHDLYRIFQQHFEERSRTTLRVETDLPATCQRRGKVWTASVLSLSDNGCLLRSSESIPLGTTFDLTLELPFVGAIQIKAESAYQLVPDLGLVFNAIEPQARRAIGEYVVDALAAD